MGELEILKFRGKRKNRQLNYMNTSILLFIIFTAVCTFISFQNYALYHSFVEILKVVCAFCIAATAMNTYDLSKNNYFILLGIGFAFSGFFNILHMLYFTGDNIFSGNTSELSVEFAIIEKYLEAITLMISCGYFKRRIKLSAVVSIYTIITATALFAVLYLHIFPQCLFYDDSQTLFKRASEAIIVIIKIYSIIILYKNRASFHTEVFILIIGFAVIGAISNIFFVLLSNPHGITHITAHIFDSASFVLLYKAIIHTSLKEPYKMLFYELYSLNDELKQNNNKLANLVDKLKMENLERERTEKALIESQERYRKLVELLPDGIIVHDGTRIQFVNFAAAQLFGAISPETLKRREVLSFIHRDYIDVMKNNIKQVSKKQTISEIFEIKLYKLDGTEVDAEAESAPIPYEGEMAQIIVVRDISERKKAEKNLKLLNETMEYDRLKTEFFSNISHELRTPLNVIYGSLQLVEMYNNGRVCEENKQIKKYVKIMKQNSFRLLRLVNNLIDITKIDSGYLNVDLKNYNIVNVVEEITLSVADYIEQRGIKLEFDTEIEEKIICCDADKIERIILNLLSNAIKFTSSGGEIKIYIKEQDDTILISIKDNGIGIPEDKLEVIFERFRQVDKSLTRNREGSGIGLSLVKSLVEMHGGSIRVKSTYGEGSEFIIQLPVRVLPEQKIVPPADDQQNNIETINIEFSDIYS